MYNINVHKEHKNYIKLNAKNVHSIHLNMQFDIMYIWGVSKLSLKLGALAYVSIQSKWLKLHEPILYKVGEV